MNKCCTAISMLLVSGFTSFCYAQSDLVVFEFSPISSEKYQALVQNKVAYAQPKLVEIKDSKSAYAMLGKRINITQEPVENADWIRETLNIYSTKGESIYQLEDFETCGFEAFYPQEQLLSFVCGHESDWLVSTLTGEEIDENPQDRETSPDGRHRISGYYNGQESNAFLQSYDEGQWRTPEVTIRLSPTVELKPEQEPYRQEWLFALMGEKHWLSNDRWIFYSHSYDQHFDMRMVNTQHD